MKFVFLWKNSLFKFGFSNLFNNHTLKITRTCLPLTIYFYYVESIWSVSLRCLCNKEDTYCSLYATFLYTHDKHILARQTEPRSYIIPTEITTLTCSKRKLLPRSATPCLHVLVFLLEWDCNAFQIGIIQGLGKQKISIWSQNKQLFPDYEYEWEILLSRNFLKGTVCQHYIGIDQCRALIDARRFSPESSLPHSLPILLISSQFVGNCEILSLQLCSEDLAAKYYGYKTVCDGLRVMKVISCGLMYIMAAEAWQAGQYTALRADNLWRGYDVGNN